jgi:hypothetical protein
VRSLAQRSASAAKEIKGLIADSEENVDAGTRLVGEAGRTMEEIVDSSKRATDIMGEITAASHEKTQGIEQINQAVTQMDRVTSRMLRSPRRRPPQRVRCRSRRRAWFRQSACSTSEARVRSAGIRWLHRLGPPFSQGRRRSLPAGSSRLDGVLIARRRSIGRVGVVIPRSPDPLPSAFRLRFHRLPQIA